MDAVTKKGDLTVPHITIPVPEELSEYREDLHRFFTVMLQKIWDNRGKGKWENIDIGDAVHAMEAEVLELYDALHSEDYENAMEEAADVANFALIIHSMLITGKNNPFASRTKLGRAEDFIKWACQQEVDHCIVWPFRSKTGPNREYGAVSKGFSKYGGRAHRVVCGLYYGDPPSEDYHAEHLCGNSLCVNPKHLKWSTATENMRRKIEHGTSCTPVKLSREIAREIRRAYGAGEKTVRQMAAEYGVSVTNIYNIINEKVYKETQNGCT